MFNWTLGQLGKTNPKRTQNEPKSNPILANKKQKRTQTNPKQTQYKPKQNLFHSKRELELANMLKLRMVLGRQFSKKPTKSELCDFLKLKECHDVLAKIIRKAKAERVGTVMAELTVCGAVPRLPKWFMRTPDAWIEVFKFRFLALSLLSRSHIRAIK